MKAGQVVYLAYAQRPRSGEKPLVCVHAAVVVLVEGDSFVYRYEKSAGMNTRAIDETVHDTPAKAWLWCAGQYAQFAAEAQALCDECMGRAISVTPHPVGTDEGVPA